ncbi:MAG: TolC family protein [Planctomycetia bacterium]|nr:TolC family protein [Planctomycetia bacterium]
MVLFGRRLAALVTATAIGLSGCGLSKRNTLTTDEIEDTTVYDSTSLQLEEPRVENEDPFGVTATAPPLTIQEDEPRDYRDMPLEEVIQTALQNSRVLRDLGGVVLKNPAGARTIHDPAITETDPRFGVDATLSAFDANVVGSAYFQNNNRALNNVFFGGGTRLLFQDAAVYQLQVNKRTAIGSQVSLTSNTAYDSNNAPGNQFYASWNTNVEAQIRQPLLQGAGADYNRIFGPSGIPGLPSGVLLARINTDASLADFEAGVRNFVSDVENAYWDLYFAYRDLDAKVAARDAALETWRHVAALKATGQRGGEAQQEAQAREQHFRLQEEVQNALTGRQVEGTRTSSGSSGGTFRGTGGVFTCERRLRAMMGIAITDGTLIRPIDEPKMARAAFEWDVCLAEALSRRPELRKQKWTIKHREMQLLASRNLLLPQLDASGLYRIRGFGKDLFDTPSDRITGIYSSAWANLATAQFQEWQLGVDFSMPLGFRKGHVAVRNAELQLARERAVLNEQERQVVLDLSNAIADMNRAHHVLETNYNRRAAAMEQLKALKAVEDPTPQMLYILLDAQRKLAEAESQYYRSLVEYEIGIKNVHFEKGSILEYNGVYLTELPSPAKAYKDALEKIKLRSRSGRWAEKMAGTRIVSEGLVQQDYSGEGPAQAVPAQPGKHAVPPLPPVPDKPAPLPQARRSALQSAGSPAEVDGSIGDVSVPLYETPNPSAPAGAPLDDHSAASPSAADTSDLVPVSENDDLTAGEDR